MNPIAEEAHNDPAPIRGKLGWGRDRFIVLFFAFSLHQELQMGHAHAGGGLHDAPIHTVQPCQEVPSSRYWL